MTKTAEKLIVEQVSPDLIGPVSKHIMPLLEKACAHTGGRFYAQQVLENCAGMNKSQVWYLWLVLNPDKEFKGELSERVKAITVTCLSDYPTGLRVAETLLIGGNGPSDEWLHYVDVLENWALKNGATRMQFIGRKGFQRKLGERWKPAATMYECEIGDRQYGPI